MDATPNDSMFKAMAKFTDATAGEDPGKAKRGTTFSKRREARQQVMDFLHHFAALCMREGAARAMQQVRNPTNGTLIVPSQPH